MDQTQQLVVLTVVAAIGVVATLVILYGRDRAREPHESLFAASTEGEKRCPQCGMGNLWTGDRCVSCGARLPDSTAQ
jgi:hypothetical protein